MLSSCRKRSHNYGFQRRLVSKAFLSLPTTQIAQNLLGMYLAHDSPQGLSVGKIVETEAYLAKKDPACHAHNGKTKRNASMFEIPGTIYVYQIYGIHHCFNLVTAPKGTGEAVLIRSLEPIDGIELMQLRRGIKNLYQLCNGPAKLVQAMGITQQHNGLSLRKGPVYLLDAGLYQPSNIQKTPTITKSKRIGISKATHLLLRFRIKESKFVSRKD